MAEANSIKLGDFCRDRLTGYEGIVVGITEWVNCCRHIGIKPRTLDKNGDPRESKWFDEPQVDLIEAQCFKPDPVDPAKTGGPVPDGRR